MSDCYTPTDGEVMEAWAAHNTPDLPTALDLVGAYDAFKRWLAEHDAKVRAEAVDYVAQIATDTLRMCQAGGVGEKNILPPEKEAGFQLCIDNIANLAKSMKEESK